MTPMDVVRIGSRATIFAMSNRARHDVLAGVIRCNGARACSRARRCGDAACLDELLPVALAAKQIEREGHQTMDHDRADAEAGPRP